MGSALLVLIGDSAVEWFRERHSDFQLNADPLRTFQAVIIGIGFVAAGTIYKHGDHVEGVTTAGTVFLTAGIGITVAVDRAALAIAATVLTLLVLSGLGWIEVRWMSSPTPSSLKSSNAKLP